MTEEQKSKCDVLAHKAELAYNKDNLRSAHERFDRESFDLGFVTAWEERQKEVAKLKAELWVAKDSMLRTYDGLAQKADACDRMRESIRSILDGKTITKQYLEQLLNDE